MKKSKFLIFSVVALVFAATVFTGGVNAVFQYATLTADDNRFTAKINVGEFVYDSGDYPPGFDEEHKTVIDLAVSEEPGGLNGNDEWAGFKFFVTFTNIGGRHSYGYVGNMDSWGSMFNAPDNVSFIMTLPESDPEGKDTIYLYVAKITNEELDKKEIDEILPDVFRCKIEKNAVTGKYEQNECKKGYSPVVYYEYSYYEYTLKKKGFAVFSGQTVWQEGTYTG